MLLEPADVPAVAHGCGLLGSGGGGAVHGAALMLQHTLQECGPVEVIDAEQLPGTTVTALVGAVGSPTVMLERLPAHEEFVAAVRTWERYTEASVRAVTVLEIGGINGLLALNAAARLGIPVVDADAMGRAFPRLDQTVLADAVPATPVALADARGGRMVLDGLSPNEVEESVRRALPSFGTWAAACLHGCTVADIAEHGVRGSVSRAVGLGRALRRAAQSAPDAPAERDLRTRFVGTVVEVQRRHGRSAGGVVTVEAHDDPTSTLRLDFSDEYLIASVDGRPVAYAPDIIAVLDHRDWTPMLADDVRTGLRIRLLTVPAPPELMRNVGRLGLSAYGMADLATEDR
ncbi:MAG: DUF917 domain-containing protein [Nocardioidaceae bacterium]